MNPEIYEFLVESRDRLIKGGLIILTLAAAYYSLRLLNRYIAETARRRHLAESRSLGISKLAQSLVYLVVILVISNVLGFGIQGIFFATSSIFALVGIAFFANWSILSNMTASVILYFGFPYRIGDRIVVENEPKYSGVLKDVTLFHLRLETDLGSKITIPANIAIQKIITIQSHADRMKQEQDTKAKSDAP